jgi:molybdate transport system substrate-binding protein
VLFARNSLALITPLDNPAQLKQLSDLPRAQRLVLGGEEVPVGRYARQLLRSTKGLLGEGEPERLLARLASEEPNAGLVRSKVALGEADAALVYATDALNSERVRVIPIPQALNVSARYPIAVVKGASAPTEARRLIALLRSAEGLALLKRLGYLSP